ncbi:hypothetical protein EASAB2608_03841 [Streptomyces sp. EAS-AB2608]|nr:hypothetical protein EASAB2608_03841 [Streptomyces sp. EAS-AB2608]
MAGSRSGAYVGQTLRPRRVTAHPIAVGYSLPRSTLPCQRLPQLLPEACDATCADGWCADAYCGLLMYFGYGGRHKKLHSNATIVTLNREFSFGNRKGGEGDCEGCKPGFEYAKLMPVRSRTERPTPAVLAGEDRGKAPDSRSPHEFRVLRAASVK